MAFIGGAYQARSVIASNIRSINYYPEINPKDAPAPVTLYQRPGLRQLAPAPLVAPVRALYRPSNDIGGFGVIGSNVYQINPDWSLTLLGAISPGRVNPCSMIDNGTEVLLVDGSPSGWSWTLAAPGASFAQISDPTNTFNGADRVDTLDTYVLWNMPGTANFGSTLSGSLTFNGLYFAGKSAYPDLLQSLIVNRREIVLPGSLKSEQWYDAGNANFPFAELPGAYIEHGLGAKYSLASNDINVYWLSDDLQGSRIVFRQRGYETTRVSNHAIEVALRRMPTVSDAIGFTLSQDGHEWYVLTFPTGNQTWVFDEAIGDPMEAWHQWAWSDQNGQFNRHRGNCFAHINGINVCGDWQNGAIYALDPEVYTDEVNGVAGPLTCVRSWPHMQRARSQANISVESNGLSINHQEFWIDMEGGTDPTQDVGGNFTFRYSDDRGKNWSNGLLESAGKEGDYKIIPRINNLGTSRFRLYEVSHSIPAQVAINQGWARARLNEQHKGGAFG